MKKVDHLTPEQEAKFTEYVKEWTDIGLCTQPADRPRAEAAIRQMYRMAGLESPSLIVWCDSPLSASLTRAIALEILEVINNIGDNVKASIRDSVRDSVANSVGNSVGIDAWISVGKSVWDGVWGVVASIRDSVLNSIVDSVGNSVRGSVRDSVEASVWDSIRASVRASVANSVRISIWRSVRNSVRDSVRDSVEASVWDSIWNSIAASVEERVWDVVDGIRNSVRDSVGDRVKNNIGNSLRDCVYGQHDAEWLAFYRFFRDECGLIEETEKLEGLWELCKSAGWAIPHKHICWVSERHNVLHWDEQNRLHCIDGPALAYPDGFAIYAWHGVRVPERIIMHPETITPDEIAKEQNAEIRRVMLEQFGRDKFLQLPNCQKVHSDDYGVLYRNNSILDVNGEPYCFVKVVNSTPESDGTYKDYILRVNPHCQTAREAVQSTFPRIKDFAPAIES